MKFNARTALIIASVLTLFLLAASSTFPMLFVVLASELGAILCVVGLWLTYREYKLMGYSHFRLLSSIAFVLLALRFFSSGFAILKSGLGG